MQMDEMILVSIDDKEHATVRAFRSTATDVDVSETSRHEYQRRWQARKAS